VRIHRSTPRRRIVAAGLTSLVLAAISAPGLALAVPQIGDTPAEFGHVTALAPTVGDTKFDSPGARRAPRYEAPRTLQVLRPERTIVRNADPVLPIVLSGAALEVALGLAGSALIRARSLRLG
jgi:hypothetical protein